MCRGRKNNQEIGNILIGTEITLVSMVRVLGCGNHPIGEEPGGELTKQ